MSNKGLSSRVLNMKFMKDSDSNKAEEYKAAKVTDSSEWSLPNASKMKKRLKRPHIENVGYSEAAGFSSSRRVFGETAEKFGEEEVEVEKSDGENNTKDSTKVKKKKKKGAKESEGFLDELWKKTQAKRKSSPKEPHDDGSKRLRTA